MATGRRAERAGMLRRWGARGAGGLALLCALTLAACSPGGATAPAVATVPSFTRPPEPPTATATPAPPLCQARQLAIQFTAGGLGGGNVFGALFVRNVSSTACALQGKVGFQALDASGRRIAASGMSQAETLSLVVLPPHTPPLAHGAQPTSGAYLTFSVMGAYRDDPNPPNDLCPTANEVTPAQFALSVGGVSLQVANDDPAGYQFKSIDGCDGRIFGGDAALSS